MRFLVYEKIDFNYNSYFPTIHSINSLVEYKKVIGVFVLVLCEQNIFDYLFAKVYVNNSVPSLIGIAHKHLMQN